MDSDRSISWKDSYLSYSLAGCYCLKKKTVLKLSDAEVLAEEKEFSWIHFSCLEDSDGLKPQEHI